MHALLADLVTAVHLAVVAFMISGLVLVFVGRVLGWDWVRNPWFRFTHLGIMAYIVINAIRGEFCFLTTLEWDLRREAGQSLADKGEWSFIGRLLNDILFVQTEQEVLDRIYLVFGAVVLLSIVVAPPRLRRRRVEAA